jgi:hypothetical protein
VCGFATKPISSIIDPVYSTDIHVATGAFCSNCLEEILRVGSGERPVSVRRNLLLSTALRSWQRHPSARLTQLRFVLQSAEFLTAAPQPVRVRLQCLLLQLGLQLPLSSHQNLNCCTLAHRTSCQVRKGRNIHVTFRRCFAEPLSACADRTAMFTDGSFIQGLTGMSPIYESQAAQI